MTGVVGHKHLDNCLLSTLCKIDKIVPIIAGPSDGNWLPKWRI